MFNPSTSKKYKPPVGRIAQVQAIQNYSHTKRVKEVDFYSSDSKRNPKAIKKNEYVTGVKEFPMIHKSVPKLLHGKPQKRFKDNDLFEMGKGDKKTRKSSPLKKQLVLDYRNEFHQS